MSQNEATEERTNYVFDLSVFDGATTETNKVFLAGRLRGRFEYSYTSSITNERYYKAIISVPRKSGTEDNVRVVVPEKLNNGNWKEFERGTCVKVIGTLRSRLERQGKDKKRLKVFVLSEKIESYPFEEAPYFNNCIYLEGTIHKQPFHKKTRSSQKRITECFLSIVREGNKWDFITCITWGVGALKVSKLNVGDKIIVKGRLQSRMYFERDKENPTIGEKRETFEVSVFELVNISKSEE